MNWCISHYFSLKRNIFGGIVTEEWIDASQIGKKKKKKEYKKKWKWKYSPEKTKCWNIVNMNDACVKPTVEWQHREWGWSWNLEHGRLPDIGEYILARVVSRGGAKRNEITLHVLQIACWQLVDWNERNK